ncbi:MAG: hypothetical protein L6R39_003913, partial [Caloplaca ligustica]
LDLLNLFLGREPDVAILVVMHVDFDGAGDGGGGGVDMVDGAPATVPEIGGGVFVGDEEEGDWFAVGGRGADGCGGGGVVFCCVRGEGFQEGGAE